MQAKDVGVLYVSGGGNTEDVAILIGEALEEAGKTYDLVKISVANPYPDISGYRLVMLGAYTIGDGRTPELMIDFLKQSQYKNPNTPIFGTGETQWREYCGAVDRLARFNSSVFPTLKIEHSPRGYQESKVKNWTMEVVSHAEEIRCI